MKAFLFLIIILCCCSSKSTAQNLYSVKGSVTDTSINIKLMNASVLVLNGRDSIIRSFTRAFENGNFKIDNLEKGTYLLVISYPEYADYFEGFKLDSATNEYNVGTVRMKLRETILKEVLIKGEVTAIKINGDTTEFNARAYVIQPNAKVEDLLKQLPGIQIDRYGKITAQGQTVKKVLLDGEEFFGDDPTLLTQNVRADMVDKVQLFDKKSDQATFTGIDDGKTSKTINITLKENKKRGYFGKLQAGLATNDYYEVQGLYNKFKDVEKLSAYFTNANTGTTGLGVNDNQKYGDPSLDEDTGDGELDSFDGKYRGEGIPIAKAGGAHYDTKWNDGKQSINGDFKIGSLDIDGRKSVVSQYNLPSNRNTSLSDQDFHNHLFRRKLNAIYSIRLDSTSTLKITADGNSRYTSSIKRYTVQTYSESNLLLNENGRTLDNNGTQHLFSINMLYTKKFHKKGRTLSISLSDFLNNNTNNGYLKSKSIFFSQGIDSVQVIDQYKSNISHSNSFNSNITFSEPLTKNIAVVMNYGLNISKNSSNRQSLDQSSEGDYDILVPALSNDFQLNQYSNQIGAIFNYSTARSVLNFGTRLSDARYKQIDNNTSNVLQRSFLIWNPEATLRYKISQQKSLRLSYNGNTTQPTISQLQPLRVNIDPLNIYTGNIYLTPAFRSRFALNYTSFKILNSQNLFVSTAYSFTTNQIVENASTDASGKTTYQFSNMADKIPHNIYLYVSFGRKVGKSGLNAGLNINVNSTKSFNMVNSVLNETSSAANSFELYVNKSVSKKYDFNISAGPSYNVNESTLQKENNGNGYGFSSRGNFRIFLPGKIYITSDVNYTYMAPTKIFLDGFHRVLLNAGAGKAFFKQENLRLTISVNDLLNQNSGFNRYIANNLTAESRFTTIKRYFMISATWDFNKMGTQSSN